MVLNVFLSDASVAARLSALDLLGAMGTAPNPLWRISAADKKQVLEFRSRLMAGKNASQRAYAANGVLTDIAGDLAGKTHWEAMINAISRVDSAD
jgi:hypothetical protein